MKTFHVRYWTAVWRQRFWNDYLSGEHFVVVENVACWGADMIAHMQFDNAAERPFIVSGVEDD